MRRSVVLLALVLALVPSTTRAQLVGHVRPTAVEVAAGVHGCLGPFGNALIGTGGSETATVTAGGEPFLNIWRGRPSRRWVGIAEHIIDDDPLDPPMVISSVWARGMAEPPTLMLNAVRCFEQEYRCLLAREATP